MPYYNQGGGNTATFGKNEYLRSTDNCQFESATYSAAAHPVEMVDGSAQKILQPGEAIAKILTGPEAGKTGAYQEGATDGRGDLANLVGVNDTFEPWRLLYGDVEIGYLYHGTPVQGWCTVRDAAGLRKPMPNAVADALRGIKGADLTFK